MDKGDIIPGDVYMGRDGRTPYLLVTNRLYTEQHDGKKTSIEIAASDVKAARRATEAERMQRTWQNSGYFTLRPISLKTDVDYYTEMRQINLQSLIGLDRLPIFTAAPSGYEFHFITSLASFKGDYQELRAKMLSEQERAAQEAKKQRNEYNMLVAMANKVLGGIPLAKLEQAWELTPETFELTAEQMKRLLGLAG